MSEEGADVVTSAFRTRRGPELLRLPRLSWRRSRDGRDEPPPPPPPLLPEGPQVDIAPDDPVLDYFQDRPEPVALDSLKISSPGVRALEEAGVSLVVPLVTQGELIGLLNLGPRLSEQDYSADDRKLLENLAGQAAPALRVAQLVREQEAEARRIERFEQELRVATLIQQNFLPRRLPEQPGWYVDALYRPAREVGGDFYDFVELDDGRLGVFVGDVTDKGVPAALVMASTRSVLRGSARRLAEPGVVLERVNQQIQEDMPPKMFVTCLYGVLEPDSGRFVFANAGHNLPSLKTADGAVEIKASGMPLGLLPDMAYEEAELTLGPGDTLVLYSDALPEAHNPEGDMYGFPRLVDTVGRMASGSVIERLMEDLEEFCGPDWEQEDDITVVTVRRQSDGATTADADPAGSGETELIGLGSAPGELLDEFTIPSQLGNEREVMVRVGEIAHELQLPDQRVERVCTAVAEAVMNAIEHGNRNDSALLVGIRVFKSEGALVVRIADQGGGATVPEAAEQPDLDAKLRGEQSPRGWGLFLIERMVDDMRVFSDGRHQVVELRVRLEGRPEARPAHEGEQ